MKKNSDKKMSVKLEKLKVLSTDQLKTIVGASATCSNVGCRQAQ